MSEGGGAEEAVVEGQKRENEVATAIDIKNAKGRRPSSGAALNGRAVAVDRELMAAFGSDRWQTIEPVVPCRQDVGSVSGQFNRVVRGSVAVGCGNGALKSSDVAVSNGAARRKTQREQDRSNQGKK